MKRDRISNIYQYALMIAAQEDDQFRRDLGSIHLLKIAYLADVEFAKYNCGKTFTETEWKFHTFGPWSVDAYNLIKPSVAGIKAIEKKIPSKYGSEDFTRWQTNLDDELFSALKDNLPLEVKGTIEWIVHEFNNDTSALLHYVYATMPMLKAAPEEVLDFNCLVMEKVPLEKDNYVPLLARLNKSQRKHLTEGMRQLKEAFQKRFSEECSSRKVGNRPEQDIEYSEVISWLDSLNGSPFPTSNTKVSFSKDLWKSAARSGISLD